MFEEDHIPFAPGQSTEHDHCGSTEQRHENTPHFSFLVCLRKKD